MAGILISIGGTVYLRCENRIVGAVLFAVALIGICFRGYALYTGKVGYLAVKCNKKDILDVLLALVGNLIGCTVGGLVLGWAVNGLSDAAVAVCAAKLAVPAAQFFVRALFCGILMYLAVSLYKEKNTVIGIFFCIPTFILCGFEHSIANMFYFSAASQFTLQMLLYQVIAVIGNGVGGMLLPLMQRIGKGK